MLGTGATATRLLFVGSGEYGRFSPHVNIGYTLSKGETSAEAASFELDAASYGPRAALIQPIRQIFRCPTSSTTRPASMSRSFRE